MKGEPRINPHFVLKPPTMDGNGTQRDNRPGTETGFAHGGSAFDAVWCGPGDRPATTGLLVRRHSADAFLEIARGHLVPVVEIVVLPLRNVPTGSTWCPRNGPCWTASTIDRPDDGGDRCTRPLAIRQVAQAGAGNSGHEFLDFAVVAAFFFPGQLLLASVSGILASALGCRGIRRWGRATSGRTA